jgi:hypothetical protein
LEDYEEAVKYLSDLDPSLPVDKCRVSLLKEAKEGIAKSRRLEQQVWKGKLKSQAPEEPTRLPSPVPTPSAGWSAISSNSLWLAVALAAVAAAVAMAVAFASPSPPL